MKYTQHVLALSAATAIALTAQPAFAQTALKFAHVYESSEPYHTCAVEASDKLKAATEVLGRTQTRAPQRGRGYGLRFHTDGGVISPGEPIMGIVPAGDDLIVQVSIDPTDIDVVKLGAAASVRIGSSRK